VKFKFSKIGEPGAEYWGRRFFAEREKQCVRKNGRPVEGVKICSVTGRTAPLAVIVGKADAYQDQSAYAGKKMTRIVAIRKAIEDSNKRMTGEQGRMVPCPRVVESIMRLDRYLQIKRRLKVEE